MSTSSAQISAATRALQSVAVLLLEDHLRHCVVDGAAASPERAEELVDEAKLDAQGGAALGMAWPQAR